jgi:hypothetical protein
MFDVWMILRVLKSFMTKALFMHRVMSLLRSKESLRSLISFLNQMTF